LMPIARQHYYCILLGYLSTIYQSKEGKLSAITQEAILSGINRLGVLRVHEEWHRPLASPRSI
jgi:hypothetical protein